MPACSNYGKKTKLYYHNFPLRVDRSASGVQPDHVLAEHAREDNSDVPSEHDPPE